MGYDDMYFLCCNQYILSIAVHVFLDIKWPKPDNVTTLGVKTTTIPSVGGQIPSNRKRTWYPLSICHL